MITNIIFFEPLQTIKIRVAIITVRESHHLNITARYLEDADPPPAQSTESTVHHPTEQAAEDDDVADDRQGAAGGLLQVGQLERNRMFGENQR